MEDRYLTEKQLAEQLNVPIATLRTWRSRGEGPPFAKLGPRAVRYNWTAVSEYLKKRTVRKVPARSSGQAAA